jgi:cytochrome c-type biogenesis protein CcmE
MAAENITIAIILIILFILVAIIGYVIYAVQHQVGFFRRRAVLTDEEE